MKYGIFDWAGNRIMPGEVFDTFEDAWEFVTCVICEDGEDEDLGEYFVEKVGV